VFYYFIIVSCFHLSLASWLLFSNKVQFSSVQLVVVDQRGLAEPSRAEPAPALSDTLTQYTTVIVLEFLTSSPILPCQST